MFRLRTTTALSLAALAVGVAGTYWLSGQNLGWAGPSERVAGFLPAQQRAVEHPRAATHDIAQVTRRRTAPVTYTDPVVVQRDVLPPMAPAAQAAEPAPPPELVPLSMPEAPMSWSQMQGHLQGNVLLHVAIDGSGQVVDAALAQSSGDPVLDAHALASVRRWRFAVPNDHPDGFSGTLPMRFTSGDGAVAQAP